MATYEKSDYEKARDERIRQNEERMKQLGLHKSPLKRAREKKTSSISKVTKKRIKRGSERRSKRLASSGKDDLMILKYNVRDGIEKATKQSDYYEDNDVDKDGNDNDNEFIVQRPPPRKRNKSIPLEKLDLSAKDRKLLTSAKEEQFLAKLREFLEFENKISEQNVRNVMRQATKLVRGEGVRYESKSNPGYSWPTGCYFMKGTRVRATDNMLELIDEGKDCEDKWGKDHGNGWLISHPLKKIHLFQIFILENPKFLKSKLRIKDY